MLPTATHGGEHFHAGKAVGCQQMVTSTRVTGNVVQAGMMCTMVSDDCGRFMAIAWSFNSRHLHLSTDDGESGLWYASMETHENFGVEHMERVASAAVKLWLRHVGLLSSKQRHPHQASELHDLLVEYLERHLA